MHDVALEVKPPYSLRVSTAGSDPTRTTRDGVLTFVFDGDDAPIAVAAWQTGDGVVHARFDRPPTSGERAHVEFVLAANVDHAPFLDAVADDPLVGPVVRGQRGLRPMRTATVTHALLQAVCGQLITAREARRIEHRIVATIGRTHAGLFLPPRAADLQQLSSAELVRCGLAPRRAAALAHVVRTFDVERLRTIDTARAVARITRERTLGPWSAGVIALHGLGRYEHGLVGDLGLIRLCANLLGRPATAADTHELLTRYGDWAGLAGVHLMRHPLARERRHPSAA